ncbi:ABC transporter six-transmembrane domain-containing protein [Aestuariirhabdus sp. Z084]|uniref:ABC transporter six-transmembrane domain-containing protein n=1 Tax=Aestuariirhabdus haliotis TaxID=2918751 RepID=UPI00201B3B12|nr:ABC transporter six-transmembrane domain-containing protein [Aestuariirhabdus haliotis]MCL6416918.1 ABC transporter six-transmembrane domain-containing protein [Aestuariirhabdus haliotis]MCL6420920.1 ABC transporter six-transmembrane domain-containing protein [Aestuariirhabdus haliotis]
MSLSGAISLRNIIQRFCRPISITLALVVLENIALAMIPLLIGFAIDDLLAGSATALLQLAMCLMFLVAVAVIRRIYDTRIYGAIRVNMGLLIEQRSPNLPVSTRNARLDMVRELVDFLEEEMPELITAIVQAVIALIILASFHHYLALSAILLTLLMLLFYALFHGRFYRLNAALNGQREQQVSVLDSGRRSRLRHHLLRLKQSEVRLSDTEAITYGSIFLLATVFIIANLWGSVGLPEVSAGSIFSIVTYSWEYVSAAIMLPICLQTLTRLQEITLRINHPASTPHRSNELPPL